MLPPAEQVPLACRGHRAGVCVFFHCRRARSWLPRLKRLGFPVIPERGHDGLRWRPWIPFGRHLTGLPQGLHGAAVSGCSLLFDGQVAHAPCEGSCTQLSTCGLQPENWKLDGTWRRPKSRGPSKYPSCLLSSCLGVQFLCWLWPFAVLKSTGFFGYKMVLAGRVVSDGYLGAAQADGFSSRVLVVLEVGRVRKPVGSIPSQS